MNIELHPNWKGLSIDRYHRTTRSWWTHWCVCEPNGPLHFKQRVNLSWFPYIYERGSIELVHRFS